MSTILPILKDLNLTRNIILASKSPRRKELLNLLGLINFSIESSNFKEDLIKSNFVNASDYCVATSKTKGLDVIQAIEKRDGLFNKGTILFSADTIVVINNEILEKPSSSDDARRMLKLLSGNKHFVHSSTCIFSNGKNNGDEKGHISFVCSLVETTEVKFKQLSDEDINSYIETGEPFDKAGSYGIQGNKYIMYLKLCDD
jgi:septum formation protein